MRPKLPLVPTQRFAGFTLIELLIVTTIIAALAVTVFAALNPPLRIKEANDARRRSDVDSLLIAIHQYVVDNDGALPSGLSTGMAETQIGSASADCAVSTGGCDATPSACVDLSTPLEAYLKSIPFDPVSGDADETNYSVEVNDNNIVTIRSCGVQAASEISSSR